MGQFLDTATFAFATVAPIFILVFLGWFFRHIKLIDDHFIGIASKLVFTVALPALIFVSIMKTDLTAVLLPGQLVYGLLATVTAVAMLWWLSQIFNLSPQRRGVFVQGSFRGNMGIVGLALCTNMYGDNGLAMGSMLLAVLTLSYNVLSVIVLNLALRQEGSLATGSLAKNLATNPLIVIILVALSLRSLEFPVPELVMDCGDYFAQLTLPLALICVGGGISLSALRDASSVSFWAVALKLVLLPLAMTVGAWAFGLQGIALGTLFLMFASPTATVSYVMVRSIGGDSALAANIVALTTLCSIFSLSLGVFLMRWSQLG